MTLHIIKSQIYNRGPRFYSNFLEYKYVDDEVTRGLTVAILTVSK